MEKASAQNKTHGRIGIDGVSLPYRVETNSDGSLLIVLYHIGRFILRAPLNGEFLQAARKWLEPHEPVQPAAIPNRQRIRQKVAEIEAHIDAQIPNRFFNRE